MRDLDDKVIYALNNSLPTASIKSRTDSNPETNCKELYDKLRKSYVQREDWIQGCIVVTTEELSSLKKQKENSDDIQLEKKFKTEQRKVRRKSSIEKHTDRRLHRTLRKTSLVWRFSLDNNQIPFDRELPSRRSCSFHFTFIVTPFVLL